MESSSGQRRRARPENDFTDSHRTQIPRPLNGPLPKVPIQLSAPSRSYQYTRTGSSGSPRPTAPKQHANTSDTSLTSLQRPVHAQRQPVEVQSPPRAYRHSCRHFSHISALSVSQPDLDSRPVSAIESIYTDGPAFISRAASEYGEEGYTSRSAAHSRPGSQGRRTKPTTPNGPKKNSTPKRDSETLPSSDHNATMEALSAAIRQGLSPTAGSPRTATPKPSTGFTNLRMPFQGEPSSPSSVYTDVAGTNKRFSVPLSSYQGYDPRESRPSTITEQEVIDFEKIGYAQDLATPKSTHPIILKGQAGTKSKVPPGKRPLRIDIGAVREAEARGSMTSLSDLIKRATRLASNLDRGRTASRLGHLDMFGGSNDRLGNGNVRTSTYSDVLNAFPSPAEGMNTPGGGRPTTMWPNGEKQFMTSNSSLGRFVETNKPKRKCCGLSPPIFVVLLVFILLVIAAAVLVPVFLIVVPKQNQNSTNLAACPTSHSCQNGGISLSTGTACSCVCVDGFTGSDCSTERDPECATASLVDGDVSYKNATIGSSVLPLLQDAKTSFNIQLSTTNILSQFAYNNLSCASENSLVDFGIDHTSTQVKRFVIVPGMMSTEPHVPVLNLPPSESKEHPRFVIVDGLVGADEEISLVPTHTFEPRQDATHSANGIVFATSSNAVSTPTTTASGANPGTATSTGSSSSPSQTSKMNATDIQLDFAATVVLYVLQSSLQIRNAVAANQAILTYFETTTSNTTVEVVAGKDGMQADFENFQIKFANGTIIGGHKGVS